MLTRDYCPFCKGQINDNEEIVQNCVTKAIAHKRCVAARPNEKLSERPALCAHVPPAVKPNLGIGFDKSWQLDVYDYKRGVADPPEIV